jgi:hypothetical protein
MTCHSRDIRCAAFDRATPVPAGLGRRYRHASADGTPCLGHAPRASLIERVAVCKRYGIKEPLSFSDYAVRVDNENLPAGVTMERWA